ncbi:hypothetical protein K461DRAFT_291830 [Myriangium duriaei CBS 260.36]|uniref:Leucine rich repeat domain-containing protein n=1 Tax=Myriangium duriaei CBS 260.36 TaxID=1168546 RepID=A0A9P4J3U0_9PEZI|nr:hypothetical protein K461DRAFT_291830 [Myriangium duriaei CBS 260.36]
MDTEDGKNFIKHLAYFVRTHEKALANALQLQRKSGQPAQSLQGVSSATSTQSSTASSTTNALAAALSLPYLSFGSQNVKPVKLTLTPHHLFYLLSRFEELSISVGPMNVRLENINTHVLPGNYVSFLGAAPKSRGRSDADSIHSVSSVRSALSTMSSMWSKLGLQKEDSKLEKQKAVEKDDLKYLYSAFTKIPCLRLAPDHRSKLISGYEEFPFDTAVPLLAFKNLSALEICDLDFRQMYGWDRLSEQLRSLTIKRGCVDDVTDLLIHIVLDDADKRRRRSSKQPVPSSPATPWAAPSPSTRQFDMFSQFSVPTSPYNDVRRPSLGSPPSVTMARKGSTEGKKPARHARQRSQSPVRPASSRQVTAHGYPPRSATPKFRRSSGSDSSSAHSTPRTSSSNLLTLGTLQPNKWRFLKHLSLADNGMTFILSAGLAPLAGTLHSLDLSSNLFTEIPESLATLTNLRALNLSNCMIGGLHSLARNPLPAITVINLQSNRLSSLAGIERLPSLEKIDLRDNRLVDPTELARLTRIPDMQQVFVRRNSFTRTHSNYRTTIFNLFRSSAGYTEDILIDSTGPTFTEKKYLVDRPAEETIAPIMRNPEDAPMPPPSLIPSQGSGKLQRQASLTRQTSNQDTASRRKAPRRRIVELSQSNPSSPDRKKIEKPAASTTSQSTTSEAPWSHDSVVSSSHGKSGPPALPPIETRALSPSPTRTTPDLITDEDSPVKEPDEINAASDVYRQKIEALKNGLGSGWLTGLNEENWERRKPEQSSGYSSVRSSRSPMADNRAVTVGARTLG